jgi:hypothetical protein
MVVVSSGFLSFTVIWLKAQFIGRCFPWYRQPDLAVFCFPDKKPAAILNDWGVFIDWLVKILRVSLLHL